MNNIGIKVKKMKIKNIWFEFEEWNEKIDVYDSNSDVIFELSDGSKWCATFFTYKNLYNLAEKNRKTGECLSGQYFYADKPIFISEMKKETIISAIEDIINSNENISDVFTKIG